MINGETNYIEIDAQPFSGVTWEVQSHETQSIGIGTISVTTASDATDADSLIALKWLQGNDTVSVEKINGDREADVSLDNITALQ